MEEDMKKIQAFAEELGYNMTNYGVSHTKVNQEYKESFAFVFERK